ETATVVGTITVGVNQVETATVTTNAGLNGALTTGGTFNVTVTAAGMNMSPKGVPVTVAMGDDQDAVATKIRAALTADADVGAVATGFFTVSGSRSEEHTSELQSRGHLVCRLLLEKKKRLHDSQP